MIFVLKQFFFGTLKIQISGSQVRRFLRLCTSQGIKIWNIKYIDDMTYTCSILWSEIYGTKSSLRKTRSKIRILQRYGFPKWIKFWKKHLILFIFILFMIAGSLNLRRCVWHIEIDGNSYISDKLIMKMLDESGVTAGQKKSRIDVDEIEKYLRIKFDSICWASAHIEGTCLYINVEEEQFDPATYEDTKAKDKCTNIYSKYDATITSIITRSGTACVKKNDEVKKGDLLVSGECPILDDNQEVTKYLYVNSDADVFGKVVYEYQKELPITENFKIKTGNNYSKYFFGIFDYNIHTPVFNKKYKNYEKEEIYHQLKIGKDFYLPIYYGQIKYKETKIKKIVYSKQEAYSILNKQFGNYLDELQENGAKILKKDIKNKKTDSHYITYGKIWTCELIGVRK